MNHSNTLVPQESEDRLLTIQQVAERLRLSVRSVETLIAEGVLKPIRITPRTRRFSREQIDDLIDQATDR